MSICTAQLPIGNHAASFGIPHNSHFRGCEEEKEALRYFIYECSALVRARLQTLGKPFFEELVKISSCSVGELLSFVNVTGWLSKSELTGFCPFALITAVIVVGVCGINTAHQSSNWVPQSDH